MPRAVVVLPTTTYRAADFLMASESLGIDLVVASEEPPPFDMGDRYVQINCDNVELAAKRISELGDEITLDGVVAADESGVEIVALTGTALGLRANSPQAAAASRNKALMRQLLQAFEVPQPPWTVLDGDDEPIDGMTFPVVMKPLTRSASQGVIRVDRAEDLASTATRIRSILGDDEPLLVEGFMTGEEIAIEGLVTAGELTVLAMFDKPDTSEGPYFPETIMVTPSSLSKRSQEECERVAAHAVRALGLTYGPVHIELKVDDDQVKVIEVAARSIGGLCSRTLSFGLMGTTLEALILRNAIGLDKPELHREDHASGVLMIPIPKSGTLTGIEGEEAVKAIDGVTGMEFTLRIGDRVRAAPEGDSYLGFVFARGANPDDVHSSLRLAANLLKVEVEP